MLALALPASAHVHTDSAGCKGNDAVFTVSLTRYNADKKNTVTITDQGTTVVDHVSFGSSYSDTITDTDATVAHVFTINVVAGDDVDGSQGFTFYDKQTSPVCDTPPPPPTTTTPPPTTTTTTAPPTTTTPETTPPATTAPPTTTSAVVAAATTTPGSGSLPFTGVNTALPLGIAGLLVVAGGGILFWLRMKARRA
ncbi:MAG TPA: hypothetical protein VFX16_22225 [Pseudonocardiaceae bacterium]|nr:hypothetical protein [Pseudonocardiaceae bacterium]